MATESSDDRERGFEEAVWKFLDGHLRGTAPDVEELVREYPEFEDQIRQKIAEFRRVDSLFDSLGRADESDFADAAAEHDLVGQRIGSFEIVEMIGRGGMGVVYLARDTKLKRSVAIKSLPAELQADSTARTRFRREAELLASLNHPNIAVIHDIIEEESGGYLILEHVPGQTLAERIAREPIELQEALSTGEQIAEAVSAAHEKGIVHRDLKPGNIKITPDGRVKVLDFGLAKPSAGDGKRSESTVTQPGRVLGTPAYMSPEQARGKDTDHRTDIWSFGCVMFQMLTGHLPFEGETATDTLARIIERQPDWETLPQDTPANIRTLLQRCLEKDPDCRLGEIADVAREIRETLSKPQTAPTAKLLRIPVIIGAAIIIVLFAITLRFLPEKRAQPSSKQIRLAVLPFENLGVDDENFADVVTEDITLCLEDIQELDIISRRCSMQYKDRGKSTHQIGEELQVNYILEGTVKHEQPSDPNGQWRIRLHLIRVSDDTQVWGHTYVIDMRDPIQEQSNLVRDVAQALDIPLLEADRRALASRPTENMEAYEYYLQGNDYFHSSYDMNDLAMAIKMYNTAVKLDPNFTMAYCRLSMAHAWIYFLHQHHKKERIDLAWEAVHEAEELDPDLPETHQALGRCYYLGHLEYNRALRHLGTALESQPSNSGILSFIGFIQRRQLKYDEALVNIEKAFENDPLNDVLATEVASTLSRMGRYSEAKRYLERAIILAPKKSRAYRRMAYLHLFWEGRTENAWAVLREAKQNNKALENSFTITEIELNVYDENYQEALDILLSKPEGIDNRQVFIPYALRLAQIYRYMGNNDKAKEYYEQAREILLSKVAEEPNDARFHSSLGIAYAGLGLKEQAIPEGRRGVEYCPLKKDARVGEFRIRDLARIYVMVNDYDNVISQLDMLLDFPGDMSVPYVQNHPDWKPLREHPRFKQLVDAGK